MREILTALALALVCVLLCLPGLLKAASRRYATWATLVFFVSSLAMMSSLERVFPWLPTLPGSGSWHKYGLNALLELLVSVGAIALLMGFGGWKREEFGLRLRFNPGTGRDVRRLLLPLLLLEMAVLGLLIPGGPTLLEDHLFMLTAPGLVEELAFRGVLLALLDRAFPGRVRVLGANLGWGAVVSSVLFGLWHGLRVGAGFHVAFHVVPMAIPLAGGFVLAWCRARSGSLLLPMLVHSGMNEAAQLVAFLKFRR